MPDWLTSPAPGWPGPTPLSIAWRVTIALTLGVAVAALHRWARREEEAQPTFRATLILLTTVIAMATQIIGDNVARAFSMVGALSVVRFRTVVKDTQDTAFVILAVVIGMAVGANQLSVGLIGLLIIALASVVLWPPWRGGGWHGPGIRLTVRIGLADGVRAAAEAALATATERLDLVSAGTARQGALLELVYRIRLRPGCSPLELVAELNSLEGVESAHIGRVE